MPEAPARTYLKLVAVAFCWGGTWIAGRVAVREASPLAIASWRFLLAALVLGAIVVAQSGWPRWNVRQWLTVSLLGLTGVFLYNVCFLYGLRHIEAGRGALVVAMTPALIAAADALFFGAPVSTRKLTGVALAMIGCLVVVTRGDPAALVAGAVGIGEWLIVGCAALWAAYTFIGRRGTGSLSPLAMTFGAALTGWALLTTAALVDGSLFALERLALPGIASIVFLGLFGTAIAFTWYADAVQRLGATRAGAFINLVPVFAVLLGTVMLAERLSLAVIAGGGLVITGVLITNRAGSVPPRPTQEIRT